MRPPPKEAQSVRNNNNRCMMCSLTFTSFLLLFFIFLSFFSGGSSVSDLLRFDATVSTTRQRTVLCILRLNLEHSDPRFPQLVYLLLSTQWLTKSVTTPWPKGIFTGTGQKSGSASHLQHLLVTWESDDWRKGDMQKSLDRRRAQPFPATE